MRAGLVRNPSMAFQSVRPAQVARREHRPCRADPVDRLPHERQSQINPASHLRSEFLETFGAERARSTLRGGRQ